MKIKVSDLEANPFRNFIKYPLSQTKVNDLKISVEENGFWGGILVRPHPTKKGKYQSAFGHHRIQAIKELGLKEIANCMVSSLTDDDMLHRMFAENHETWGMRPGCILENVEAARDRLNSVFSKYDKWEDVPRSLVNLPSLGGRHTFNDIKTKGAGRGTIRKYLGDLYNENQVKEALNILKVPENGMSIAAAKDLPSLSHVAQFRKAVKDYEVPQKKHVAVAKQVVSEGVGRRGVRDIVAEHALPKIRKKVKLAAKKPPPAIGLFIMGCEKDSDELNRKLKGLLPEFDELSRNQVGRLVASLKRLHPTLNTIINKSKGDMKCRNGRNRKGTLSISTG